MSQADNEIRLWFFIPLVILNALMLFISVFLFFLLIKSKAFNNYQCYNIIILSLVILLDCVVRIIPFSDKDDNNHSIWEYMQASLLTFFDKAIIAAITTQTILFYLGVIHTKKYYDNDSKAFFISFVINIVICLVLTILYIIWGDIHQVNHRLYFYCGSSQYKTILDPIFNSIYLVPNFYCSLIVIMFLFRKLKEVKKGLTEDADYRHHFKRILIMALLNFTIFLESYLIIFEILKEEKADILYLSTLLLISLFNCGNKTVTKETMKICCKKKYKERYGDDEKSEEGDENNDKLVHRSTYSL